MWFNLGEWKFEGQRSILFPYWIGNQISCYILCDVSQKSWFEKRSSCLQDIVEFQCLRHPSQHHADWKQFTPLWDKYTLTNRILYKWLHWWNTGECILCLFNLISCQEIWDHERLSASWVRSHFMMSDPSISLNNSYLSNQSNSLPVQISYLNLLIATSSAYFGHCFLFCQVIEWSHWTEDWITGLLQ